MIVFFVSISLKGYGQDSGDVNALINEGKALYNLERYEEAIEYYDRALAIDPNRVSALANKGLALDELGRSEEAIEYYDRALAIDPNYVTALTSKGLALVELGRSEEAIEYYDKALAIDPNYESALYNKGNLLLRLERYQEAIEFYDKVLALDPNDSDALNNIGVALSKLGRSEEAIKYYDRALQNTPFNQPIGYKDKNPGKNYFYESVVESMDKSYVKVMHYDTPEIYRITSHNEVTSISIDILVNKGIELAKQGKYQEAISVYDVVLSINANHIAALVNKAESLKRLDNIEEAAIIDMQVNQQKTDYRPGEQILAPDRSAGLFEDVSKNIAGLFEK